MFENYGKKETGRKKIFLKIFFAAAVCGASALYFVYSQPGKDFWRRLRDLLF